MFRKSVALIMIVVCTLVCLPVFSMAAESDLQADFDNGLMTLKTSLTYYKTGSGYTILRYFNATANNISKYGEFTYNTTKYNSSNPNYRFGHLFELSYNDGRVLMAEGDSLTFSIHNFYSTFYFGDYVPDDFDFDPFYYFWLDLTQNFTYFIYFFDFEGNHYTVDKSMYEISINQEDAMITVKLKSDMYDFDVYRIRLFVNFKSDALYNSYLPGWAGDDWFDNTDSVFVTFGYENLFFEISSDEAATTGLLTSIIEYIKNLPANIKTALSSLFDSLSSSISVFFTNLESKLSSLFSVFTEEQTTYAPIDEGELPSDYQAAEDEAFDSAGVGDLDSKIDSAFKDADSVFSNNNAYAFISGSMEQIVFGNLKISGLVIFSLAMGLCVLVLGRKLNSA